MQSILNLGKVTAALVWLWGAAGIAGLPVPFAEYAPTLVLSLGLVHAMEVAMFLPKLRGQGDTLRNAIGILMFGLLHYHSVKADA